VLLLCFFHASLLINCSEIQNSKSVLEVAWLNLLVVGMLQSGIREYGSNTGLVWAKNFGVWQGLPNQ
jgi:hypothetical protein